MSSSLENIFNTFRGNHKDIDCRGFVKLCRDTGIVDESFSANDAERVFQQSIPVSKRRLNLKMLLFALQMVADRKGVEAEALQQSVNACLNRRADLTPPVATACMMHSCMKRAPSAPAAPAAHARPQAPDVSSSPRSRPNLQPPAASACMMHSCMKRFPSATLTPRGAANDDVEAGTRSNVANLQPPAASACMMHSCMKRFPSASSATRRGPAHDDSDARTRSPKPNRIEPVSKSFTLSNTLSFGVSSNRSTSCAGSDVTGDTNSSSDVSSPKVHMLPSSCPAFCLPLSRRLESSATQPKPQAEVGEDAVEPEQPPMSQSPKAPPPAPSAKQAPKGSQTRNPRGDLQSHFSQAQSLRRGKPANLLSPKLSAVSVEEVYAHFCGGQADMEMDCKSFLKMCKRSCLIDQTFTPQDARLIFGAVVHVSKQRMDFESFESAIGQVAVRKGLDVNLVRRMVAWSVQSGEASLKQSVSKAPAAGDASTTRTWPEQACSKLNFSTFMSGSASSLCTASSLSTFRRSHSVPAMERAEDAGQASGSLHVEREDVWRRQHVERDDAARPSSIEREEQAKPPQAYIEPALSAPTASSGGEHAPRGRVYTSMPLTQATRPRRRTAESQPPSNSKPSYVDYPTAASHAAAPKKKVYASMPLVTVTVPHRVGQAVGNVDLTARGDEGSKLLERPECPPALAVLSVPGLAHRRFYPSMQLL